MEKIIIIATKNKGKAKEFKSIFEKQGYTIKTLLDFPEIGDIAETGTTFSENAFQKASVLSNRLNTIVLADDSGLVVDALDGRPGIYSARYGGEHGNDEKNNRKLLEELKHIPLEERNAHFHCTLALVGPNKKPLLVDGQVSGRILDQPKGENGFGYDPLFFIPVLDKTMAELTPQEKNKISHRARAIKKLQEELDNWL